MLPDLSKPKQKINYRRRIIGFAIMAVLLAIVSLLNSFGDLTTGVLVPAILSGVFIVFAIVSAVKCRKPHAPDIGQHRSVPGTNHKIAFYRSRTILCAAIPFALTQIMYWTDAFPDTETILSDNEKTYPGLLAMLLLAAMFFWIASFYCAIRWTAAVVTEKNKSTFLNFPLDVKIFGWWYAISGICSLYLALNIFPGMLDIIGSEKPIHTQNILGISIQSRVFNGIYDLIFGLIMLAIGIGLLRGKKKAWLAAWVLLFWGTISWLVLLPGQSLAMSIVGLSIIAVTFVWLIYRRKIFLTPTQ